MAIYKMVGDKERLEKVAVTSLGQEGILERADLQRILSDQPEVLEEGLLIIAEEFGSWQDSNRRIDLLALDSTGRLVVIELKRGETGSHMDLQAIRYAAMVANMTYDQVVATYQEYLEKRAAKDQVVEDGAADNLIREHLPNAEEGSQVVLTEVPRIILASEDFSRELTTCVLWLNDSWLRNENLDIKCIRLQPHRNGDQVLVETSIVVPLPEASDYQTRLAQRERESRVQNAETAQAKGKAEYCEGVDLFYESISLVQEQFHAGLNRLCSAALKLQKEALAELFTLPKNTLPRSNEFILELRLPGKRDYLVAFRNFVLYKGRRRAAEISFHADWEELAPNALPRIEELIGDEKKGTQVRYRNLGTKKTYDNLEGILAAITQAYREANGQPSSQEQASANLQTSAE